MLPRCLVFCALLMAAPPNAVHFGRNVVVAPDQTLHNIACLLCSAEVGGHATGSVRVFAGNVSLNGSVAGNVLVFGGNLTLGGRATVRGQVFILGGRMYSGTMPPAHTVFPPIVFLPLILVVCLAIGGLIVLTRRMVRGPVIFPPLPRL
jgi:hypothetical protein